MLRGTYGHEKTKLLLLSGVSSVLIAVAAFSLFESFRGSIFDYAVGNDDSIMSAVSSPNGEHVATKYIGMGGGAAGWCGQRISINKREHSFDLGTEGSEGEYVFSASCGSEVEILWESGTSLRVSYATQTEAGVSTYQRPLSRDGAVKISYLSKGLASR